MNVRFVTSMALVCTLFAAGVVRAEEAVVAEKGDEEQSAVSELTVSAEEAIKQQIESGRQEALKLRTPRDEQLAEVGKINEQMTARREAIIAENEEAAALKAEIAELDKALEEKSGALAAILDGDEALQALRVKLGEAQVAFRVSQIKLREEVARQHRERRLLQDQARQTAAAQAAVEAAAEGIDPVEKQ